VLIRGRRFLDSLPLVLLALRHEGEAFEQHDVLLACMVWRSGNLM